MSVNWFLALPIATQHWYPHKLPTHPENIILIRPENIHLTVAFLGNVEEASALMAWQKNQRFQLPPLSIQLQGIESFGNPKRPALAATLQAGKETVEKAIAECRQDILAAASCEPETNKNKKNVTKECVKTTSEPEAENFSEIHI